MSTYSVYNIKVDNQLQFASGPTAGYVLAINADGSTSWIQGGGGSQNLQQVLAQGNSVGTYSINGSNSLLLQQGQYITNPGGTTYSKPQVISFTDNYLQMSVGGKWNSGGGSEEPSNITIGTHSIQLYAGQGAFYSDGPGDITLIGNTIIGITSSLLATDATGKIIATASSGGGSGTSGSSGSSGTSGVNGAAGSSGTSGVNGAAGSSGTSGVSGTSGTTPAGGGSQTLQQTLALGNTTGTYSIQNSYGGNTANLFMFATYSTIAGTRGITILNTGTWSNYADVNNKYGSNSGMPSSTFLQLTREADNNFYQGALVNTENKSSAYAYVGGALGDSFVGMNWLGTGSIPKYGNLFVDKNGFSINDYTQNASVNSLANKLLYVNNSGKVVGTSSVPAAFPFTTSAEARAIAASASAGAGAVTIRGIGSSFIGQPTYVSNTTIKDQLICSPFRPQKDFTSTGISIANSLAAATGRLVIAIYDDNNGYPNNLMTQSTEISWAATGVKTFTYSTTYQAGTTYWIGIHTNGQFQFHNTSTTYPIETYGYYFTAAFTPTRLGGWAGFASYSTIAPSNFGSCSTINALGTNLPWFCINY